MFINIQYVCIFATLVSIDLFHILFGTHHFPCASFVVAIQTESDKTKKEPEFLKCWSFTLKMPRKQKHMKIV